MKIIVNRLEIEKYLETKETNILVNNIINDYLENFAHDEHETMDGESLYENMLEDLEIDPLDKEFKRLAKAYSLPVSGCRNTGKSLPTCLYPKSNISSIVEPTTT